MTLGHVPVHNRKRDWPSLALIIFFVASYRITQAIYCRSYFVADETWQSLEVAHRLVFGYGELTWEWQKGIRSAIFPSMFALIYRTLKAMGLDNPTTILVVPRIFMACLLVCQDFIMYWIGGMNCMAVHLTLWSSAYFGTRTLSNSFETLLSLCSLCFDVPLSLVMFSFWVRPTSLIGSAVLLWYKFQRLGSWHRMIHPIDIRCAVALLGVLIVFDKFVYSRMSLNATLTPLSFMYYNFVKNWAVKFGTQPIYWYFLVGIPQLMLLLLPYLFRRKCISTPFFVFAVVNVAVLSLSPHKEIRYLAPVVPYLVLSVMAANPSTLVLCVNGLVQLCVFLFLSQSFLHGQAQIMTHVADRPVSTLFLLPCYSTPGACAVHANVELRVLQCNPANSFQESQAFIDDPLNFVQTNLTDFHYERVVTFASYGDLLDGWLTDRGMKRVVEIFNSYFEVDNINNSHVVMYEKQTE